MDASSWFGPEQIYVASFVVSFVSGFLPLINTEAYLLSVAALSEAPALPVIALATLGQMAAKFLFYLGGRGLLRLPSARRHETLDKLRERLERRRGSRNLLIFLFPSFYIYVDEKIFSISRRDYALLLDTDLVRISHYPGSLTVDFVERYDSIEKRFVPVEHGTSV